MQVGLHYTISTRRSRIKIKMKKPSLNQKREKAPWFIMVQQGLSRSHNHKHHQQRPHWTLEQSTQFLQNPNSSGMTICRRLNQPPLLRHPPCPKPCKWACKFRISTCKSVCKKSFICMQFFFFFSTAIGQLDIHISGADLFRFIIINVINAIFSVFFFNLR